MDLFPLIRRPLFRLGYFRGIFNLLFYYSRRKEDKREYLSQLPEKVTQHGDFGERGQDQIWKIRTDRGRTEGEGEEDVGRMSRPHHSSLQENQLLERRSGEETLVPRRVLPLHESPPPNPCRLRSTRHLLDAF